MNGNWNNKKESILLIAFHIYYRNPLQYENKCHYENLYRECPFWSATMYVYMSSLDQAFLVLIVFLVIENIPVGVGLVIIL